MTITDVHSNKVRYVEGEGATSTATVINTGTTEQSGTLVATLTANLDAPQEVGREALTLAPGQQSDWSFAYNVGPETYGRVLEVRFLDPQGQVLDSWQEYYVVAKEFMRVQQHTYNAQAKNYKVNPWTTYLNFTHNFASEPTDWGVYMTDTEEYLSGQAGYDLTMANRKYQYAAFAPVVSSPSEAAPAWMPLRLSAPRRWPPAGLAPARRRPRRQCRLTPCRYWRFPPPPVRARRSLPFALSPLSRDT